MSQEFIKMTQGPAVLADSEALNKDKQGLTHPCLHRRIKSDVVVQEGQSSPTQYNLSVQGLDSYRTTKTFVHDEESTTSETP